MEHAWTLSLLDALPNRDTPPAAAACSQADAEEGGRRRTAGDADSAEEGDTAPFAELSVEAKEDVRNYLNALRRRARPTITRT